MRYLSDPIVLSLAAMALVFGYLALSPRRRPDIWLVVLGIMLLLLPRAGIVLEQLNLPLPLAHVLVILGIFEWVILRQGRFGQWSNYHGYFLLYAMMVGVGLAIGMAAGANYRTAFLELCFYLFAVGLFFYVTETFRQPRHFFLFTRLFLVTGILVGIYGVAQQFFGASILIEHVTYNSTGEFARTYVENPNLHRRVLSSYGDPNVLAGQMVMVCTIGLSLLLGRQVGSAHRFLALGALITAGFCIYFTGSRAGMICLIFGSFLVLIWRSRWMLLMSPALIVVGILMIPSLLETVLISRFGTIDAVADVRSQFPRMAWELFRSIPFGCGLGRYININIDGFTWSYTFGATSTVWSGFNSFWLNLFSRLGVVGLIAFAMLFFVVIQYVWLRAKTVTHPEVKAIAVGGLVGIICQALIWLFNNTYILPGGGLNFWFLMGMLVAGVRAFQPPRAPMAWVGWNGPLPTPYPMRHAPA